MGKKTTENISKRMQLVRYTPIEYFISLGIDVGRSIDEATKKVDLFTEDNCQQ